MDQREFIKKLMLAPENEIVIFVFTSDHESMAAETSDNCNDNKVIRALKSQLVDASPVFERMFRDRNLNMISMSDEVSFDQYEVFKMFISILHNLSSVSR